MRDLISRSELMKKCSCKKNCADCDFYTDGDSWCDGEVYGTTIMWMPSVEVPGWISVKNRLPKDDDIVLTYHPLAIGTDIEMTILKGWSVNPAITSHWMPLPEPPEVEDGNA